MSDSKSYSEQSLGELIGYSGKGLREQLDQEDWQDSEDDDRVERAILIGTVFNLYPSGKFYMPWCSNFTEEEADKDSDWRDVVDEKLNELNLYMFSGEGDPCDLFVGESKNVEDLEEEVSEEV
jgi:hypothetical protein